MAAESASTMLLDIFRRADKNDDGSLSKDEFCKFFSDDVMTRDELEAMFTKIDKDKSDDISPEELTEHFGTLFSEFDGVFDSLSKFSSSYSTVLAKSFETDVQSEEHFAMRFLVTELAKHLEQVSQPLEAAQVQMIRAAVSARPGKMPFQDFQDGSGQLSATRQAKRAAHASENAAAAGSTLEAQVSRLAALVDGLSTKANLGTAEISRRGDTESSVLVHSAMDVQDDQLESFREALTRYAGALNACESCKHVRVLYEDESVDCYEIWTSQEALEVFRRSSEYKAFLHASVESLERPMAYKTMDVPGEWFAL